MVTSTSAAFSMTSATESSSSSRPGRKALLLGERSLEGAAAASFERAALLDVAGNPRVLDAPAVPELELEVGVVAEHVRYSDVVGPDRRAVAVWGSEKSLNLRRRCSLERATVDDKPEVVFERFELQRVAPCGPGLRAERAVSGQSRAGECSRPVTAGADPRPNLASQKRDFVEER